MTLIQKIPEQGQSSSGERNDKLNERLKELEITDCNEDALSKDGNVITRDDIKTVDQPDIAGVGEDPITQAMWVIIKEPSYMPYGNPWMRPATMLSDKMEQQYQAGIGCQTYSLEFERNDGSTIEHIYEHDFRRAPWVQKRFQNSYKKDLISCKHVHRVLIQGSKT